MTSDTALERPSGRRRPPIQQPAADGNAGSQQLVSSAPTRPQASADAVASIRVTIYSDAHIEHWLDEVRVQSAIARLDLTHSAVWRRAMYDLIRRFTPEQIVQEFQAQRDSTETVRPGRPRR